MRRLHFSLFAVLLFRILMRMQERQNRSGGRQFLWALAASVAWSGLIDSDASAAVPEVVPGKYIVVLRRGATSKVFRDAAIKPEAVYTDAIEGFVTSASEATVAELRKRTDVLSVEPDIFVRLRKPEVTVTGRRKWIGETVPTGVARIDADLNSRTDASGIGIAILDTGISRVHSDLNIAGAVSFVHGSATGEDDNGHGSHCAGIAGAKINGFGVRGVAPNARLFGVKVLNRDGTGRLSRIILGVDWVTRNAALKGIHVANMSFSFRNISPAFDQAVSNSVARGVTYVAAAGNGRRDANTISPARHPGVICVSALADSDGRAGHLGPATGAGGDDTLAWFSNLGEPVEIAAPGVKILSTYRSGKFATLSGTSMASPHVAGAAALYIASNPGATPAQVKAALLSAAWPQDSAKGFTRDRDSYPEPLLNAADL